jgi:poly(A) polymerase
MKTSNEGLGRLEEFVDSLDSHERFSFLPELRKRHHKSEIYLVGGIIRDKMLGRESYDVDFVVRGIKASDLEEFLSTYGKVNLVGTVFGVFRFIPRKGTPRQALDIALPRTEVSTGRGGRRDFEVQYDHNLPIEQDLSRRDFTINAMAYNVETRKLIDPYEGMKDLRKGRIRTVGEPGQRFAEDYSRILRGLRIACQLDFSIEKKTWEAIRKHAPKIMEKTLFEKEKSSMTYLHERTKVPWEMVGKEFMKTLEANPERTLDIYDRSGILKLILPEMEALKGVEQPAVFHPEGDVFVHTKLALDWIPETASVRLALAIFLHDIGKPDTQKTPEEHGTNRIRFDGHDELGARLTQVICKRLKLSRRLTEEVSWLVRNHMLFTSGNVYDMRPRTIKKYFLEKPKLGSELLELYRIEIEATKGPTQKEDLKNWYKIRDYIKKMRKSFKEAKVRSFTHIISGHDVMKEFSLPPGPGVGEYLEKATEFVLRYITENKNEPAKEEVLEHLKQNNAK